MRADPPRHGEEERGAQRRGGGAHRPEVPLWQRLRGSPMGFRFGRQHPIALDRVRVPARDMPRNADEAAAAVAALAAQPRHHRRKGGGGPPPQPAGEDQE